MINRIILISWLLLQQFGSNGQSPIFNHLMSKNGLSQNSIFAITQDHTGFMWYGSRFGLNRYDGFQFRLYKSIATNEQTLSDDYITALYTDSKGTLWIGTANGLNRYNAKQNTFERIFLNPPQKKAVYNGIKHIYEDKKGYLWVATNYGLYVLLNKNNNQFSATVNLGLTANIANDEILSLANDSDGYIWAGTNNGLIRFLFNKKIYGVKVFKKDNKLGCISDNAVTSIVEDKQNRLWFGTENGGLNLFNKITETFTHFVHIPGQTNTIVHNAIRKLMVANNGALWVGTQEGLSVLNIDSKSFTNYQHKKTNANSLNQNSIYSIYEDSNGSIWIGTYYGGVNVIYANPTNFKNWQYNENISGLSHNVVSSIIQADGNNFWIGTEGGGLNYYDWNTKKFKVYNQHGELGSNLIKVIYKDKDKNVWIGTHGGGLNILDKNSGTFKRVLSDKNEFNSRRAEIVAILEDNDGLFWVGSQTGLNLFNRTASTLTPVANIRALKSLVHKNIKVLFEDSNKNIWIATTTGLYRYIKSEQKLVKFDLPKGSNSVSNNSNYINCIQEDSRGNIWIGLYYGGLTHFNSQTNSFSTIYTTREGLSNNNVLGILEDTKQFLWISTSNGLNKFDPDLKTFQNYNISDGLAGDEFNYNSSFVNKSGEMFFGGYNGLTFFSPNEISTNTTKAPIVFTRLRLFGTAVKINDDNNLLKQDIGNTEKILFKYDQNIFTIEFALLNYIKSTKNKYAYRLEGINDQWIETDIPSATYTNLPAGKYTLWVKGANNDGIWSKVNHIKIEILPPFWKTWWAFCIYILIVAAVIFFVTRFFYLRELLLKDEELHQVKLNFFTNVSHEIRTHLTLIMAPIDKLMEEHKGNNGIHKQLYLIKSNADRLLRLVSELLDFRKAETKNLKLHMQGYDIIEFLDDIFKSFEHLAQQKNITFNFIHNRNPLIVYFDKTQLEKVFFNLISNAFKFTSNGQSITLKVETTKEKVNISISDTGRGIAAEHLEQLFSNFFQVDDKHIQNTGYGIGLALTKAIVELHHGQINIDSELADNNNPGYSIFTVSLWLGTKHLKPKEYQTQSETTALTPITLKEPVQIINPAPTTSVVKVVKPSVLVIDDNADIRLIIQEYLAANYQVYLAKNGLEGWNKAIDEIPDLIISDVMMPQLDGVTLCNRLKTDERTSHIPVILLTAKSTEDDQISGLAGGADVYISKPFSNKILQLQVRNLLNAREAMRKKFSKTLLFEPQAPVTNSLDEKFLAKLINIIENHMEDENLSVEMLSEKIGMSQSVLYKKLKALTNLSIHEFSKSVRLKKAAQLLKQKQYAIYEIGYMVGFSDRKYFSREFKKQFGQTPSEYLGNDNIDG
ncbi:hybrid sensor histidine kinase/response regulator transcription factor [Pedobacter insulae]|uniref:histidine kinase n=1 Tax=Pedobacter insulae TaxID=414048 RepID=A0A1I2WRF4_9SPHI|nr:hybrid sensor histidine kinase/response regulator transcription factor [Pedobacter insulae]SFH03913.1 Two component regulator propeller [Pedobacter insulae]